MGFFSGTKTKTKFYEPPEFGQARQWGMRLLNMPPPTIPTAQIAGMTGLEEQGQDVLRQYIEGELPESFYTALDELTKTATGEYTDITKQPWYKSIVSSVGEMGNIMTNRLGRRLQLTGMGKSSPGARAMGREVRKTQETLAGTLAPYAEAAQGRKFRAAEILPGLAEHEEEFPVRKMAAVSQFGALPRLLEQAGLDAEQAAQIMQILFPYTYQADIMGRIFGSPPREGWTVPGGPSELEKISSAAGNIGQIISAGALLM